MDHRVVLPECRSVEVRQRLAADRRRRPSRPAGIHHAHRPRKGRHQVRRRMDLIGRIGTVHHGPPRGTGGRRGGGARRALAGATVGGRRVKKDASATAEELRKHLCDKVARFWLPERWTFIDEVPKTSVGKFDKKLIRSHYADGVLRHRRVPGLTSARAGRSPFVDPLELPNAQLIGALLGTMRQTTRILTLAAAMVLAAPPAAAFADGVGGGGEYPAEVAALFCRSRR